MAAMKRGVTSALGVAAIALAVFVGTRIGRAESIIPKVPGTYLVTLTLKGSTGQPASNDNSAASIQELATFTDSGQVLTSDQAAFGLLVPAALQNGVSDDVSAGDAKCAFTGELRGGGHGSWRRTGLNVDFMILWTRFDGCGKPNGFMRARGRGRPTLNGDVSGMGLVEFFPPGEDPIGGKPSQSIELAFVAARVPAVQGMMESNFDVGGDK